MKKELKFLVVLWTILLSGSVVFLHYYTILYWVYVAFIIIHLLSSKIILANLRLYYTPILIIGLLLIGVLLVNKDFSAIRTYTHFYSKILLVASIAIVLPFIEFKDIYLKIIFSLALISLLIYPVVVLFPSVVLHFNEITMHEGAFFHNLYLSVYNAPLATFPKNASVFWEGGAYQAFLNIAIAFELKFYKFSHKISLIVFILAILTTFSTTGYIILIVQLSYAVYHSKSASSKLINHIFQFVFFMVLIFFVFSTIFKSTVNDKFTDSNYSYYVRLSSTLSDLIIFTQSPILVGVGYGNYQLLTEKITYNKFLLELSGSVNSFTQSLAVHGLLLFSILLFYYSKFANILSDSDKKQKWMYFALLVIIFSTENFYNSFIFLIFLFYGISYKNESKFYNNINYKIG